MVQNRPPGHDSSTRRLFGTPHPGTPIWLFRKRRFDVGGWPRECLWWASVNGRTRTWDLNPEQPPQTGCAMFGHSSMEMPRCQSSHFICPLIATPGPKPFEVLLFSLGPTNINSDTDWLDCLKSGDKIIKVQTLVDIPRGGKEVSTY